MTEEATMTEQPKRPLEFRDKQQGVEIVDVSFPERRVEVVVMPYEEKTVVEYKGRPITEIIDRGAFDGVQRRGNRRIRVNRDHDISKVCGHTIALHPDRQEGLVADVFISNTPLGNETLELCNDGVLDASAAFAPLGPAGDKWENRSFRRILKAWLGHIAFVPEPAYEGAKVLAVRQAAVQAAVEASQTPTPNIDTVRSWKLQEQLERLGL